MTDPIADDLRLDVEHLATMKAHLAAPVFFEGGPSGTRIIVEFTSIEWTGPRVKATSKGRTHGDWLTVGPEGTGKLDFRFVLETDDGATLFVSGLGRNHAPDFAKGGENYFAMSFETGDARYAWLNPLQALGKGRTRDGGKTVDFEVWALR